MHLEDTIIALSTASGPAARGILRISGPDTVAALREIFRPIISGESVPKMFEGSLIPWGESRPIPAKLFFWPRGRGYTGQESVEIHTIGSPPLLDAVLSTVLLTCEQILNGAAPVRSEAKPKEAADPRRSTSANRSNFIRGSINTSPKRQRGAISPGPIRLARPGEFTLRAFLSGRLDLTQAEAVLGVIDATSENSLETALKQLAGNVMTPLRQAREALFETLAHLEAGLDFAEEEIEFITRDDIRRSLRHVLDLVEALRTRMDSRSLSSEYPAIVLSGPPNSGKSTLFNVLAGSDRTLVSSRPGTTRDYIETKVRFGDLSCILIDTAGIDETRLDEIDDQARRLSAESIANADLILYCNSEQRATSVQRAATCGRGRSSDNFLKIRTKSDLIPGSDIFPDEYSVSAKTGSGIDALRREIARRLDRACFSGDVVPGTASRCRESLAVAAASVKNALQNLDDEKSLYDDSLLALELRGALDALGLVDGSVHTEDLLDRIFDRFCIGK